jgi:type I restriction enzyme S subunit
MKYKQLYQVAKYRNDRISSTKVNDSNYISTENMIPNRGGVERASTMPITKSFSKYVQNDILLSNIRPYFRKIWFADIIGGCSNDVLVVQPFDIDAKFLYYVLSDNNFFNYSTVTAKGTKMPRGSQSAIMKYLVPNVNKPTQTRIADILSAYDDAIENNNRRIALLEKTARELYREWFVRFRFPGHEKAKFVNGLPDGWDRHSSVEKIAKVNPSLLNSNKTNGIIKYIDISSIEDGKLLGYTDYDINEAPSRARRKIRTHDILYSTVRPNLKGYKFISSCPENAVASTGFAVIRALNSYDSIFLYHILTQQSFVDYFSLIATGTSYPAIKGSDIERVRIILPHSNIRKAYYEEVMPMYKMIDTLEKQSQNLARQRDLLLPRLMSGKLEV